MTPINPQSFSLVNSFPFAPVQVPLIVGITGHMNLPEGAEAVVRQRLTAILQWLREGPWPACDPALSRTCHQSLGLQHTPVLLLSSLAPGVDQMAAEAALALGEGYHVRCPLPFPTELYREASTFLQKNDGDQARQQAYDGLLSKLSPDSAFFVWREEDVSLPGQELKKTLIADLENRERRNLRYRAAGEFISAYCDILIAVCDQNEAPEMRKEGEAHSPTLPLEDPRLPPLAQSGARTILRSHLHGLEPGILPLGAILNWADNGPVIRIFCPNKKSRAGSASSADPAPELGHIAIWHPKDSSVPEEFQPEWHQRKMQDLRVFATHLEELNAELAQAPPVKPGESDRMFQSKSAYIPQTWIDAPAEPFVQLWKKAGKFFAQIKKFFSATPPGSTAPPAPAAARPQLERIATLRRGVVNLNYGYDDQVKHLKFCLFLMSFSVVVLLQLHENWQLGDAQTPGVPGWRVGCFYAALALFFGGFLYHGIKKRKKIFDRQNDYRAVAEGLRVQHYWSAAGLGLSAASNYLQRARGELSWIRAAIASASFPYEAERRAFAGLDDAAKHARLTRVCEGWLGEQEWFFTKSTHQQSCRKQRLHTVANLCLIAAFFLILARFIQHAHGASPAARALLDLGRMQALPPLGIWLGAAGLGWLLVQGITFGAYKAYYADKENNLWAKLSPTLDFCVRASRFLRGFHHWGWLWFGGLTLGWALHGSLHWGWASSCRPAIAWLPASATLGSIMESLLLAVGGLLHTFAAFKFVGENTRRYAAMRDLFRASRTKLTDLLNHYQQQIAAPASVQTEKEKEHTLRAIQEHLAALGKEALHENTDWLQMHRNKPVEPVLPVG